jgi:hypothetical protein
MANAAGVRVYVYPTAAVLLVAMARMGLVGRLDALEVETE